MVEVNFHRMTMSRMSFHSGCSCGQGGHTRWRERIAMHIAGYTHTHTQCATCVGWGLTCARKRKFDFSLSPLSQNQPMRACLGCDHAAER